MPLTISVMRQSISNFRLYCTMLEKKNQMLLKKTKVALGKIQVCIFMEIVFGIRCTLTYIILGWKHKHKQTFAIVCLFIVSINKLCVTDSSIIPDE